MNKPNNTISRRQFIGTLGAAAAVTGLASCVKNTSTKAGETFKDEKGRMEYRSGVHGEQVSLLGYGCMRWPTISGTNAQDQNDIDQETVNKLVDYAPVFGIISPPLALPLTKVLQGYAITLAISSFTPILSTLTIKMPLTKIGT